MSNETPQTNTSTNTNNPSAAAQEPAYDADAMLMLYAKKREDRAAAGKPTVEKPMNYNRSVFDLRVTEVYVGKGFCTLGGTIISAAGPAPHSGDVINWKDARVATVDKATGTQTMYPLALDSYQTAKTYWASQGIPVAVHPTPGLELNADGSLPDKIVYRDGDSIRLKVDTEVTSKVKDLPPFSVVRVGVSCSKWCTTLEQSKKSTGDAAKRLIEEGISVTLKQVEIIEIAKPGKVFDLVRDMHLCRVPLPTPIELRDENKYEHVLAEAEGDPEPSSAATAADDAKGDEDTKKKKRFPSKTLLYLPLNLRKPWEFFTQGKALVISLTFKENAPPKEGEAQKTPSSPFFYQDRKDKSNHARLEGVLVVDEIDPRNPAWNGNVTTMPFSIFESTLAQFRIKSLARWAEIAPMIFTTFEMLMVGNVDLFETFENPQTKDNLREGVHVNNFLALQPRQLVANMPEQLAWFGVPLSRAYIERQLATDTKWGSTETQNQLMFGDRAYLNLTEWDAASAAAFIARPTSRHLAFFAITDTPPMKSLIEVFHATRAYMEENPGAPGCEMLLDRDYTKAQWKLWAKTKFGTDTKIEVKPDHPSNGTTAIPYKSLLIYAVDMEEISKRRKECVTHPLSKTLAAITASTQARRLAIAAAPPPPPTLPGGPTVTEENNVPPTLQSPPRISEGPSDAMMVEAALQAEAQQHPKASVETAVESSGGGGNKRKDKHRRHGGNDDDDGDKTEDATETSTSKHSKKHKK